MTAPNQDRTIPATHRPSRVDHEVIGGAIGAGVASKFMIKPDGRMALTIFA
jgi:hypothetical protein